MMKRFLIICVVATLACACDYYEWDKAAIAASRQEVSQMDCVELLAEISKASRNNDAALTRITGLTPSVVSRLIAGESMPTKGLDWWLKNGPGADFYKYHKSFFLLRLDRDRVFQERKYLFGSPVMRDWYVDSLDVYWEKRRVGSLLNYKQQHFVVRH